MDDGTFKFNGGKSVFNITMQKNKALEPYGKCIHNYGVLLELIPGDKQTAINQQIGNARVVHNDYLSKRIDYYKESKETMTVSKYKKDYLPALKEEKEYLKDTDKFVYENACRNVDDAYSRFFKGLSGFPKYASKTKPNGNSFTTNFTNNNIELKMVDGIPHVKLPKIGYVRFILPKGKTLADIQPHGVSIKAATVSRESNGTYTISLRMDSVIDNVNVYHARIVAGKALAESYPVDADLVVGVPDSGLVAAKGYSEQSGIPYGMAFHKNSYVGRTFIKPKQSQRESSVKIKLNVIEEVVKGKRIVMVDDSIVRGTTCANIIKMLKKAGAKEVHVRISSPPFLHPCYFGTDVPSNEQLIAHSHTTEQIREMIGADSLGYMEVEKLKDMVGDLAFCDACFTGNYPMEVPGRDISLAFE